MKMRAVLLSNGVYSGEAQCKALLQELGFSDVVTFYVCASSGSSIVKTYAIRSDESANSNNGRLTYNANLCKPSRTVGENTTSYAVAAMRYLLGKLWTTVSVRALESASSLYAKLHISPARAANWAHIQSLWLPLALPLWKSRLVAEISTFIADEFDRSGRVLVVASGSRTVPIAAAVKDATEDRSTVVQILHPRCSSVHFDAILLPEHDPGVVPGPLAFLQKDGEFRAPAKVIRFTGALHSRKGVIEHIRARQHPADVKAGWPGLDGAIRLALVVGGPTKHCRYTPSDMDALCDLLSKYLARESRACLSITTSRRTPTSMVHRLSALCEQANFAGPKAHLYVAAPGRADNPYAILLSLSDAIVVSGDSVMMSTEACSSGVPVFVAFREKCRGKLEAFHSDLAARGYTCPLVEREDLDLRWDYNPLDQVAAVADELRQSLRIPSEMDNALSGTS